MIHLFDFQRAAAAQIAGRFFDYWSDPPITGSAKKVTRIPFYQALSSITASGKTVILAEAVAEILPILPVPPIVLWLSKGKVVVRQSYANLQDGGKYRHLLGDFVIRLLAEYDASEVKDESHPLMYFATVGTFNQKSKEKSALLLFQSDLDNKEEATWEALKQRETEGGIRRPLLIVYDEGHNLTDQQTDLLMELEPDAFLVASATMKLSPALAKVLQDLKARDWSDEQLTTYVSSRDVVEAGLIKRDVIMGGYAAAMERTIDDLLEDMTSARAAAKAHGLAVKPKAIYVSKTNIKEGNSFQRDNPKRPFRQREAPPIRIWRYLVEEKKVDPSNIAVYCSLDFDKSYPPPTEFVLFKGGDADYEKFVDGDYRHVIFNMTLQEGWDDPGCYFAYIDKSMGSNIQVEQIIGRVMRQPEAQHYVSDILNTAHFYVRVDTKGVFADIVKSVRQRLALEKLDVQFASYEGRRNKPVELAPRKRKEVPHIYLDPSEAVTPIQQKISDMNDYRGDTVNVRGEGALAQVQQRVGEPTNAELKWVTYDHNNAVSARWVFQLAVSRVFPRALEVTPSDNPKFDARIELNSNAYKHIQRTAEEVVAAYLEYVTLKQGNRNPFVVGPQMCDPTKMVKYKNALHEGYSGLNNTELKFAGALDKTKHLWCRNASRSGFGIPLLSPGQSKYFYPDFLVWKGSDVVAIDTTGGHLLLEKTNRKLLYIESPNGKRIHVRLVAEGQWDENVSRVGKDGWTGFTLTATRQIRTIHCATAEEAVKVCLSV